MGFGKRAPIEVAAHVHLEAEAAARVDQLDREKRLVRLTAHERVLVAESPSPVVALMAVRGEAPLDELAVGSLDVAKEAIRTAEHGAGLDVTRCREEPPHAP